MANEDTNNMPSNAVIIRYTNHRGETADRRIAPRDLMFRVSEWHREPQWILMAWDFDKRAWRDFAMKDIASWRSWTEGGPTKQGTLTEAVQALREAGGDDWDKIDDPEAFLGRK